MSEFEVELKNINKSFGDFKASRDINFGIKKGRLVGLLGPSGSGKTTIARMICNIYKPDNGKILYFGKDINSMAKNDYEDYRKNVQMVFQDPNNSLNPKLKISSALKDGIKKYITKENTEIENYMKKLMDIIIY